MRHHRVRRVVVAGSILGLAAGAGLWLSRVPIATSVIDRELAARGVTARYHITDLGLGRQRLTDVVVGDPRRPDWVADWIETETDVGLSGPRLIGVRAGHVRGRARLANGVLSLGPIDRLIPQSTGAGPFSLPALQVDIADARIRLETPQGLVGVRIAGSGALNDGFRGSVAVAAPRLTVQACRVADVEGVVAIAIRDGAPHLSGPVSAGAATCPEAVAARSIAMTASASLDRSFRRWSGVFDDMRVGMLTTNGVRLTRVAGDVTFAGDRTRTGGSARLSAGGVTAPGVGAARATMAGRYAVGGGKTVFAGDVVGQGIAIDRAARGWLGAYAHAADGAPIAPLVRQAVAAGLSAGRDMTARARLTIDNGTITLPTLALASRNGARVTVDGAPARWGAVTLGQHVAVAGGGLPTVDAQLGRDAGGALTGIARIAPYAVPGAALTVTPVRFTFAPDGSGQASTQAIVSGPLAGGRVERLTVPLAARWSRRGVTLNPGCTPVSLERLVLSSLRLDPARLTLCPTGAALVEVAGGRLSGGARVSATALHGAIGRTPLRVTTGGATLRLNDQGFALRDVDATLGPAARATRLSAGSIDGRLTTGGVVGRFTGLGGQIANVPLVMSAGQGTWRFTGAGGLAVDGAMQVRDAEQTARFEPMEARSVAMVLRGDRIEASGTLIEPTTGVKVAEVTIGHQLSTGAGAAALNVPGITFTERLQPELLTRLTFGVIADVHGAINGTGEIRWNAQDVTSSGTFTTSGIDLAAAFGPVKGIAGTIRFTDLLALESAPGQVATVASINPGVPVTDGRIVYQTLRDTRVKVDSGTWPFAGGTLTLEPTLLDFSSQQVRRMTFRVDGMDAGKFLPQFDFKNLSATGVFDGVLPMVFDADGGRIQGGRLTARAGGGGIAYLGELTEKDLGFWGNLAFQSLRSLTYRQLEVEMNGPLAGEMVTGVRFTGIRQGTGAKSNFLLRRLTRLPIVFNITIRAPFRGLIDSAASFYDPQRLVARNLQPLIDEQNRKTQQQGGVQPPASENVP